jgi:regulator of protease activity HflC (stomatin/prohibitin superfamily)
LHLVVPLLEHAVRYPIYNQSFSISRSGFERGEQGVDDSISARSKEGQEVFLDATLIYRIDPARLNEIHIAWQDRYLEQLVRPLVRSTARASASQRTVEQIYSSDRIEMQKEILDHLSLRLKANGLVAKQFVIRDVSFKDDYAAAVEAKVITEQEALRADIAIRTKEKQAEQIRQLAQGEADAVVIKAQADAEALALVNQVLQENPEVLNYEYIKRLAPNVELLLISSENPVIYPLSTGTSAGGTVPTNPLIPQMPPSGMAADESAIEPQMPPSGLAPDAVIGEDESPYSDEVNDTIYAEELDEPRTPAGQ